MDVSITGEESDKGRRDKEVESFIYAFNPLPEYFCMPPSARAKPPVKLIDIRLLLTMFINHALALILFAHWNVLGPAVVKVA